MNQQYTCGLLSALNSSFRWKGCVFQWLFESLICCCVKSWRWWQGLLEAWAIELGYSYFNAFWTALERGVVHLFLGNLGWRIHLFRTVKQISFTFRLRSQQFYCCWRNNQLRSYVIPWQVGGSTHMSNSAWSPRSKHLDQNNSNVCHNFTQRNQLDAWAPRTMTYHSRLITSDIKTPQDAEYTEIS